jgi:urease accessory protein
MKARRALAVFIFVALEVAPASAEAHLVSSGMGPLYDGISHFGLSPEDFLPVIAFAFFAGLRGPAQARLALAILPLAWLVGGLFALYGLALPALVLPVATAILFLLIGGLLATDANVAPPIGAGVAACLGLVRGAGDLAGVTMSGGHILTLLGMAASVFAVFALAASVTLPLQRLWMIVAARVSGSWLAALGLLFAGWILRYGARVQ